MDQQNERCILGSERRVVNLDTTRIGVIMLNAIEDIGARCGRDRQETQTHRSPYTKITCHKPPLAQP